MSEHVLSILVKALGTGQAAKDLKGVDGAIASIGKGANKFAAPIKHFGGVLGSIGAGLGIAGLAGAGFSIAGALEQGISKADAMASSVEKLTGVTDLSAHSASQLVAIFDRFGIDGATAARVAGFAEKTLGKMAGTTTKAGNALVVFDKKYGLALVDAKGKVVDYATELSQVADFYTSNASASDKAAVASKLFGKSYVDLIPILKLGAQGIADLKKEADDLGLTLKSAQDVTNVQNFIKAQRDAKEAIGGLEMQIGLLVMPDLTSGLKSLSGFIATHKDQIKQFFSDGLKVAEGLGRFVTGQLIPDVQGVAGVLSSAWGRIPKPFQDMIVKGVIADRTMKFLFDISPIHATVDVATEAIKGALEGVGSQVGKTFIAAGIGKAFVQPVFVTNPGFGGGAAGPANAVEDAAGQGAGIAAMAKFGVQAALAALPILIAADAGRKGQLPGQDPNLGPMLDKSLKNLQDSIHGLSVNISNGVTHGELLPPKPMGPADPRQATATPGWAQGQFMAITDLARKVVDDLGVETGLSQYAVKNLGGIVGGIGSGLSNALAKAAPMFKTDVKLDPGQVTDIRDRTGRAADANAVEDRLNANRAAVINAGDQARSAGFIAKEGGMAAAAAINAKKLAVTVHTTINNTLNATISNHDASKIHQQTQQAYVTSFGGGQ
jgi:hypothetical protein